jgi:AbrB family looped-hinge helix DNA binding protein
MMVRVKIDPQGGIVIPPECMAAVGIRPGDELLIEAVGDGEWRLLTRAQALKQAQAIVAPYVPKDRDLVAELIAERREEAAREC